MDNQVNAKLNELVKRASFVPEKTDKQGPLWSKRQVSLVMARDINGFLIRTGKSMSNKVHEATEQVELALDALESTFKRFNDMTSNLGDGAKKASGSIRDSAERLNQGLTRIEKAANFDRLERYAVLIERVADGMERLSALEKDGKLERVIAALK